MQCGVASYVRSGGGVAFDGIASREFDFLRFNFKLFKIFVNNFDSERFH